MTKSALPNQSAPYQPAADEAPPAAVRFDLVPVAGDLAEREPTASIADEQRVVPDRHRYTGPELSALLNQVRRELGVEASIMEANRVRSGGFAGFFAKESYEVVAAAPAAATTRRSDPAPPDPAPTRPPDRTPNRTRNHTPDRTRNRTPDRTPNRTGLAPAPPPEMERVPVPVAPVPRPGPIALAPAPQQRAPSGATPRAQRGPAEISIALLERAEAISALERASVRHDPDRAYDLRDGGPARFGDVLEAELVAEPTTAPPVEPRVVASPQAKAPVEKPIELGSELDIEPSRDPVTLDIEWAPEPTPAKPSSSAEAPQGLGVDDCSTASEHPGGRLVTIVGSIQSALGLARRVVADPRTGFHDFVVVTPEPAVMGLPSSRVGRHYEALTKHLYDWTLGGRSGIVVVDAALATRLRAEVLCLRHLGADSVYVVDDRQTPAAQTLEQLDGIDGTIVFDATPDVDQVTDARR